MNIPVLSQRDPRWADMLINKTTSTVGSYGCTLTCLSMLFDKTSDEMNIWLAANRGYVNDLIWWVNVPYFKKRFYCERTIAPVEEIREELKAGHAILLAVHLGKDNPLKPNHWVLCTDENFTIHDPWFGDTVSLMERYGSPEKAILGGAYFDYPPPVDSHVENPLAYPKKVQSVANLRVRQEANTQSPILGTKVLHEVFDVIGQTEGESINGTNIWFNTGYGYVHSSYTRSI